MFYVNVQKCFRRNNVQDFRVKMFCKFYFNEVEFIISPSVSSFLLSSFNYSLSPLPSTPLNYAKFMASFFIFYVTNIFC